MAVRPRTWPWRQAPTVRTFASCRYGAYASVIEKLRPGAGRSGEIVHATGRVLGEHRRVIHYTGWGQRRDLESRGLSEPLYVVRLDCGGPTGSFVGPKTWLATRRGRSTRSTAFATVSLQTMLKARRSRLKIRSTAQRRRPCCGPLSQTEAEVRNFAVAEGRCAPTAACVFYEPGSSAFWAAAGIRGRP